MNITRLKPIKGKTAAANTPVEAVFIPKETERVIIQIICFDLGANEGILYVLQTKDAHSFSQKVAGNTIVIENCPTGYDGRTGVIRFNDDNSTKIVSITAQSGNQLTVSESIPITERAKLYVLEKSTDSEVQSYSCGAGERTLYSSSYGFAVGEELGYPIALWNVNTAGDCAVKGGVLTFVSI